MIEAILVLAIIGAILGTVLGVADKFLKVEVDPRERGYVLSKLAGAKLWWLWLSGLCWVCCVLSMVKLYNYQNVHQLINRLKKS